MGAEELEIYGYVGKETAKFKNGATARDIANSINSSKVKPALWHRHQHTLDLLLPPIILLMHLLSVSFDLYGMNTTAVPITASVKFGTGDNSAYPDLADLRDKINGFSGDTGINARLSSDGAYIDLTRC